MLCSRSEFNERVKASRISPFEVFTRGEIKDSGVVHVEDEERYFCPYKGKQLCLLPQFFRGTVSATSGYTMDDVAFVSRHLCGTVLEKLSAPTDAPSLVDFSTFLHDRVRALKQIVVTMKFNVDHPLEYVKAFLPLLRLLILTSSMLQGQEAAGFNATLAMQIIVDQAASVKETLRTTLRNLNTLAIIGTGAVGPDTDSMSALARFLLLSAVEVDAYIAALLLRPFTYPDTGVYSANAPGNAHVSHAFSHAVLAKQELSAILAPATTNNSPLLSLCDAAMAPLSSLTAICASLVQGNWWRAIHTVQQLQRQASRELVAAKGAHPLSTTTCSGGMALVALLSASLPHWRAALLTLRSAYAMPNSSYSMTTLADLLAQPLPHVSVDQDSALPSSSSEATWPAFLSPAHILATLCRSLHIPVLAYEQVEHALEQSEERGLSWLQLVECEKAYSTTDKHNPQELADIVQARMKVTTVRNVMDGDPLAYGKYLRLSTAHFWRAVLLDCRIKTMVELFQLSCENKYK